MGVKFELFGRLKKRPPQKTQHSTHHLASYSTSVVDAKDLTSAEAIAQKLLKQGKTEEEVRMYLKEKGFNFREIENALAYALRERISEGSTVRTHPPISTPSPQQQPQIGPSPSPYIQHPTAQTPTTTSEDDDYIFLQEMEELVDMVIKAKYSKIMSLPQQFHELKEEITKLTSKIQEDEKKKVNQIRDKIESIEETIKEHTKIIEEIEPRLNALENAFKDTIPQIIDDLRRIEEHLHLEQKDQIKDTKIFSLSSTSFNAENKERSNKQKGEEQEESRGNEVEIKEDGLPFKLDDLIS